MISSTDAVVSIADNTPVIIGVGQYSERVGEPGYEALSSMDMAGRALAGAIEDAGANPLVHASLAGFTEQTASEAPAPGGGKIFHKNFDGSENREII